MEFMKDVVTGAKKLLTVEQTSKLKVTKYNELKTSFAIETIKDDDDMKKYVLEKWLSPGARVSRD